MGGQICLLLKNTRILHHITNLLQQHIWPSTCVDGVDDAYMCYTYVRKTVLQHHIWSVTLCDSGIVSHIVLYALYVFGCVVIRRMIRYDDVRWCTMIRRVDWGFGEFQYLNLFGILREWGYLKRCRYFGICTFTMNWMEELLFGL